MKLEWIRPQSELQEVLREPQSLGPEVSYWIFSDLSQKWNNMTIIAPGLYGSEFPKTYGHYHTQKVTETYRLVSGNGIFILQKKHYDGETWVSDMVSEVYMVKLNPGDEIVVPLDFGHSWTNVGDTPLIVFDDWRQGHVSTDYEAIKELRGMDFYVVKNGGGNVKFEPNKNYKNHPEPKVITASEFMKLYPNK
jgi:glucose-6-phosphate isomerase, archaeal